MSSDEKVPDNWLDTLDKPPVSVWFDNENYPMDRSKEDIIKFLKQKKDTALGRFVTEDVDDLPQSFVHWWLYTRDARRTANANGEELDDARPEYPTLVKWLLIVQEWKTQNAEDDVTKDDVTHADIFGTFKAWLDILFVDMTVYDNEDQRKGVPRRIDNTVMWESQARVRTRKETMDFIICEGLKIMKERGWTDGYDYWKRECKKYLVFT
jgi:hypothetical protein